MGYGFKNIVLDPHHWFYTLQFICYRFSICVWLCDNKTLDCLWMFIKKHNKIPGMNYILKQENVWQISSTLVLSTDSPSSCWIRCRQDCRSASLWRCSSYPDLKHQYITMTHLINCLSYQRTPPPLAVYAISRTAPNNQTHRKISEWKDF
jgi:hypothetical protein